MIKGQGVHQIGQPKSHQDKQGHPQACSILFHRCAQHNVIAFPDEEDKTSSGRLDSSVFLTGRLSWAISMPISLTTYVNAYKAEPTDSISNPVMTE
jgi:hypothetical protein